MCCVIQVFSKAVGLVIVSEGGFVLLVSCGKSPSSLSNIGFVTVKAGEFVCT